MKGSILLVIALAAAAQAQPQAQQSEPCLKLSKVKVDGHVLHQNGAAKVHLVFTTKHCYVYSGAPQLAQMPEFSIESQRAMRIEPGARGASHFDQNAVAGGQLKAQEISLDLNVLASPDLELGEHKVPGVVRYQAIDEQGNLSPETLTFEATIKVDPPSKNSASSPYDKPGDWFQKHPVWTGILLPVFIVIAIPMFLIDTIFLGWDGC